MESDQKPASWKTLTPLLVATFGFMLMLYMIIYEDEPGGIPLIMIVVGTIWYFIARRKSK